MKQFVGFAAAAAVTAMIGAAFAAEGDQFLIKGDATKGMLEQNMLNIATADALIHAADMALLAAKAGGKGRYVLAA